MSVALDNTTTEAPSKSEFDAEFDVEPDDPSGEPAQGCCAGPFTYECTTPC